ncbi:hypothetical protein C5167_014831 [Papaver somniferum]|uniref:Uncharacterized protein n=1 Tax=Papaver somniferum TaxID=3469 RepID=A0A4Y7J4B7_PAPSO|nr:zinc transporter 1-like [Papaver somniferum]XP_026460721.1 zinc transporter 1-like [Papaver somniferum]RZC55973.1 hypothetical protein C5167_014831 [Papaver somniferum]
MGGVLSMETVQLTILIINIFIGAAILCKVTSFAMVLILLHCAYSGLEGIAVGVAAGNETDAWTSLWNMSLLRKIIIAFSMGTALFKLLPHKPYLASVAYLSAVFVATPIGVAIGIHIDTATQAKVDEWIFVMTTGSIDGIFVYDTALTVLSGDSKPQKPSFLGGFASVLLGVGLMAVISSLESYYNQSMSRNLQS